MPPSACSRCRFAIARGRTVIDPTDLAAEFEAHFGRTPRLYRAPGRVNLIGEHTDYNDGFVMPIALDRSTWVAAAPGNDRAIVVRSREYAQTVTLTIGDQPESREGNTSGHWSDYVRGVASVLGTSGADLLVATDVPIGAGLASSAALEVAIGYALLDLANAPAPGEAGAREDIDLTALALACQRAEHAYAGTRCGVMDQMIACHGRADHALMLDTRTLQCRWLPLPARVRVVVCNTMVTHQLAAGEYNARRADCEAGVRALGQQFPRIRALRDATMEQLGAIAPAISDRIVRRCRHVISENARVEQAARALTANDFVSVGGLMRESHVSLRDDYEVSCAELNTMVAIAGRIDGVYGARMTGGGFGGCAIALADAAAAEGAAHEIARR
ncbi:MAG: galactokinase [Acidobacteria bacterium]|nr:MAG: galactokinase [Acidobacteriota bacterium]